MVTEPTAARLDLPKEYGTPKRTLGWDAVRERLVAAERYWLATTRPDGRPHVVPVDGIWLDDAWYYGGSHQTVHHRNLEANPEVVVCLEDAAAAVIVEGVAAWVVVEPETGQRLAKASKAKYGYGPSPESYAAGVWQIRPRRALAWASFPEDATRFVFEAR